MREHFLNKRFATGFVLLIIIMILVLILPTPPNTLNVAGVWPSPGILYKGDEGVSLTFNVELGDDSVLWLLEELEQNDIRKATFFLDPAWVDRQDEVVKEIALSGFDIGVFDPHPSRFTSLEPEEVEKHLKDIRVFFEEHGLEVGYYRTKDELLDPSIIKLMSKNEFIVVGHQVSSDGLNERKTTSFNGAVVEMVVPNRLQDVKDDWAMWFTSMKKDKNVSFVSLLELMASSDSKIRLLE
ncbi:polysaccharide deacetylase family protein [Jeotgalibacillus marinus]|uniref:Polysaccharide deacetylase family protein n=1 Tax=Jeotgalibacillus marinus TaxID=86667 RepID=A0ABV3Q5Y1_9BACL